MDDLISRRVTREAFEKDIMGGLNWDYILSNLPSAQPQWIPCSETVDIPDHEVLCCDRRGEELVGWLSYVDEQWLCESNGEMMYNPVAWMPLPEPYREEGKQE